MSATALVFKGWVSVYKVDASGARSLHQCRPNVLTQTFFDNALKLLRQAESDNVTQRRAGAMWFEADNESMPLPQATDTGPHSASTVIAQIDILASSVTTATISTSQGAMQAVRFTARLLGDDYAGQQLCAVGLYTAGDGDTPDPDLYTAGQNGVYLLARQAQTLTIEAGAAWDFVWTIAAGALPADVVIEEV